MVREVKALGLETCMTLGMLNQSQAERLKDAGLVNSRGNPRSPSQPERHTKLPVSTRKEP